MEYPTAIATHGAYVTPGGTFKLVIEETAPQPVSGFCYQVTGYQRDARGTWHRYSGFSPFRTIEDATDQCEGIVTRSSIEPNYYATWALKVADEQRKGIV